MLIEFRVSNFRSIGEEQVLSLVPATNQKEFPDNIFSDRKNIALNVIAMYGANGSGKSNLLRAFTVFYIMVRESLRLNSIDNLIYDPFLLREGWQDKPTSFEIIFSLAGLRYRYGFQYNHEEIIKEWLFRKAVSREVAVFLREGEVIDTSSTLKGNTRIIEAAVEATKGNSLFLTALDSFNIEEASDVFNFLMEFYNIDGKHTDVFRNMNSTWESGLIRNSVVAQMKRLKLGLVDIVVQENKDPVSSFSKNAEKYKVFANHTFYDAEGKPTDKIISWEFAKRESSGSIKSLEISSPLSVVLGLGGVLIIDEMEAQMHPLLTMDTINLFLNKETNPKNAQLIFATHDTNLLSYCDLRRDQIYFAEKNNWESTEIYSLSDFVYVNEADGKESKERPDTDKEKRYIEGRYGAIPVLGPMAKLKSVKNG